MLTVALFIMVMSWKQPKCPSTSERTKTPWSNHMTDNSETKCNKILGPDTPRLNFKCVLTSEGKLSKGYILYYSFYAFWKS